MSGVCTGPGPCDTTPFSASTTDNWVARVDGLPLYIRAVAKALVRGGMGEQEAIATAVATVKRWAAGEGHVTDATRERAAKAVAEWDAKKAESHRRDMATPVTEGGSAGSLLPQGPSPKVAAQVDARLAGRHRFRGRSLLSCAVCGQPITDPVHVRRVASGERHSGPDHAPVPTGHVNGNPVRHRMAEKAAFARDADHVEGLLRQAMLDLFERQRSATVSRLTGDRGRRMLRRMTRSLQPALPPPSPGAANQPTGPAPAAPPAAPVAPPLPVSPPPVSAIFDVPFWTAETAAKTVPVLETADTLGRARADRQLGDLPAGVTDIQPARLNTTARADALARTVTATTYRQLQQAVADSIAAGETLPQLTARIQHVFDVSRSRAEMIARTETIAALNQAAFSRAAARPGLIAVKEWLAHHDTRTRATHRVADGQTVPMGSPFTVGTSLMMYPGDPSAPPDEVCNCRCSLLFHPAPTGRTA